jgi:hypothetical protein
METTILILAYVANVLFCRRLTRLAVRNQGKSMTLSHELAFIWFIPILGNVWCLVDFFCSFEYTDIKRFNLLDKFFGRHWN